MWSLAVCWSPGSWGRAWDCLPSRFFSDWFSGVSYWDPSVCSSLFPLPWPLNLSWTTIPKPDGSPSYWEPGMMRCVNWRDRTVNNKIIKNYRNSKGTIKRQSYLALISGTGNWFSDLGNLFRELPAWFCGRRTDRWPAVWPEVICTLVVWSLSESNRWLLDWWRVVSKSWRAGESGIALS